MGELRQRMGAVEFGQWQAFMHEEGLGPAAQQHQWAEMMAALWNGPMTRKSKAPWKARDFVPNPWAEADKPKPATGAHAVAFIGRLKAARGQG